MFRYCGFFWISSIIFIISLITCEEEEEVKEEKRTENKLQIFYVFNLIFLQLHMNTVMN